MSNGRKLHKKLPEGVELNEIVDDRIWVLHPTKGYRTREIVNTDIVPNEIPLITMFKIWFN